MDKPTPILLVEDMQMYIVLSSDPFMEAKIKIKSSLHEMVKKPLIIFLKEINSWSNLVFYAKHNLT
jgi:hypothetical protein